MKAVGERSRPRRRAGWPIEPTWDDRVSDRANPVLVRDVVQLRHSRVALVCVCILSFVLLRIGASMTAGDEAMQAVRGRAGFDAIAALVVGICWAVVPFLTFLSTREEVTGSVSESLLLSGLSPARILTGKLQSALLRAAVIGGLASPLLALGHAVRGVTLPTLLLTCCFCILGVIAWATLAVAAACACRGLRPRAVPIALAATASTVLIAVVCPAVPALLRALEAASRTGDWSGPGGVALAMLFVAAMAWCAGKKALAHGRGNHSTSFRVVGLLLPIAVMLLLAATAVRSALPTLAAVAALAVAVVTAPLWIGAATEDEVRHRGQRSRRSGIIAVLSAPLAPGRGNGLLFVLLLTASTAMLGFGLPALLPAAPGSAVAAGNPPWLAAWTWAPAVCVLVLLYQLLYSGLAALIRGVLDRRGDPRAGWLSRLLVPLVAVASWTVPLVWNGIRGVRSAQWNLAHLLNPVATAAQAAREGVRGDLLLWLAALVALLWLYSLPTMAAALRTAWRAPAGAAMAEDDQEAGAP